LKSLSNLSLSKKNDKIVEKIATPNKSILAPTSLSILLLGYKSPNPTVDSDVNAKYIAVCD